MDGIRSSPLVRKSPNHGSPEAKAEREQERHILLQSQNDDPMSHSFSTTASFNPNPEVVVKVEPAAATTSKSAAHPPNAASFLGAGAGDPKIWRGASYDFRKDIIPEGAMKRGDTDDSSSDDGDDSSVEFDFQKHKGKLEEGGDLESQTLSPVSESPNDNGKITPTRDTKVLFQESELFQRRQSSLSPDANRSENVSPVTGREDEVVRCSSNSSFQQRKSRLSKTKTKSRLMDPPEETERRSGRSKASGLLGPKSIEDVIDEDDPFLDEDMPENYHRTKFGCSSIIQLVSLIVIVAAVICSLVFPFFKGKTIWGMRLWKWGVMILVLICGGLLSGWVIRLVVFFIERNFLLRKRVLYFVYGLRRAVQNCLWLGWVLLAWTLILDKKVEKETHNQYLPYVTRVLVCLLIGTIIWLFKTLLVKVLAMSFHVTAFFDRIQEALFDQYLIETLSGPPLIELQRIHEEEERVISEVQKLQNAGAAIPADIKANCLNQNNGGGRGPAAAAAGIGRSTATKTPRSAKKSPRYSTGFSGKDEEKEEEGGISIDRLHRLNQKNISAWNMKRLMNTVRKGVISTLDEQLADSGVEDETSKQIRSEKQAKGAAKKIFYNVARPGSKLISVEDLMRFMNEDEAIKAVRVFERASDAKGVSKRVLKNWAVNVFRERRALALSLNDTKTAVNKLHNLVNVLIGIGVLIIWLMILGVPITHFLVFISSQLLLLTFMFGNTFKTTFESIIFLFVMHPYDVGDRCEIDGVQMVVEEMNILTTVFLRYDNQKIIYPNNVLAEMPISNYFRSPDMGDAIDFYVHISTPVEKLSTMKERITKHVESKSNHWYPAPMIVMRDVEDMNRIKFSVWLSHTMNHQDMGERWTRRGLLVEEMVNIFRDLDIEYRMLPMDVNVRALPSLTSNRLPSNWSTCAKY